MPFSTHPTVYNGSVQYSPKLGLHEIVFCGEKGEGGVQGRRAGRKEGGQGTDPHSNIKSWDIRILFGFCIRTSGIKKSWFWIRQVYIFCIVECKFEFELRVVVFELWMFQLFETIQFLFKKTWRKYVILDLYSCIWVKHCLHQYAPLFITNSQSRWALFQTWALHWKCSAFTGIKSPWNCLLWSWKEGVGGMQGIQAGRRAGRKGMENIWISGFILLLV